MGGPRGETLGVREGRETRYRVSPRGDSITLSESGIGYRAGTGRCARTMTATAHGRKGRAFEPPYAEIGSPRMRRCRDTIWYVQGSAVMRDVSIRSRCLKRREGGKGGRERGREREERWRNDGFVDRRSSRSRVPPKIAGNYEHREYFRISLIISRHPERSGRLNYTACQDASAASTQNVFSFADSVRRSGAARALGAFS